MAKYLTKQRALLVSFLEKHPDKSFTAKGIRDAVGGISLSAVYRNLAELEKDGSIRKHDNYYGYVGAKQCKTCLHMVCNDCGKSYHLPGVFSEFIISNIMSSERFAVDKNDTVIYGVCRECRR